MPGKPDRAVQQRTLSYRLHASATNSGPTTFSPAEAFRNPAEGAGHGQPTEDSSSSLFCLGGIREARVMAATLTVPAHATKSRDLFIHACGTGSAVDALHKGDRESVRGRRLGKGKAKLPGLILSIYFHRGTTVHNPGPGCLIARSRDIVIKAWRHQMKNECMCPNTTAGAGGHAGLFYEISFIFSHPER